MSTHISVPPQLLLERILTLEIVRVTERAAVSAARPPLRVTMLGLRGFPNVQGGVENHAQNLSYRLVELGCDVEVIVRSAYVPRASSRTWHEIKLVRIWSPRIKGVEAFLHTLLGVMRAAWTRPDILHIHAVGPALFTPLARALGLRVIVTHLGLDNSERRYQVGKLLAFLRVIPESQPVVLLGDINEWLPIGRPLRWLHHALGKAPSGRSFPVWAPLLALDRIWSRPTRALRNFEVYRSPAARVASDHYPVRANIGVGE